MSFNRLDYDSCTYKQELSESIAPWRIPTCYTMYFK